MQSLDAIDQPFPDVTLPTLDGDTVRFADRRGKRLLLYMWGSW
jgi:peroxiredoxin